MKPKLLSLVAVAAWLFSYTPAQAGPSNPPGLENEVHYMCYQLKETKKVCWGTLGVPSTCALLTTGTKTCYGGADDGETCIVPADCDTLVCQVDNCIGTSPCYNGFPKGLQVDLEDQFEVDPFIFDVKKPKELCLPADKDDEDEDTDPEGLPEHLESYQIALAKVPVQPKHEPQIVLIQDQFGSHVIQTTKENRLFVPTLKLQNAGPGDPPTNIDHYKCYKAKILKKRCISGSTPKAVCTDDADCPGGGECDVTGYVKADHEVEDQFQTKDLSIAKFTQLCNPVDKNGEGILDNNLHYTCYQAKTPKGGPKHQVELALRLNSQLGKGVFSTVKEWELCLPALKDPTPATTTTTTTSPPPTTTTLACNPQCTSLITPGTTKLTFETTVGTGNCGTLRNFKCSNDINKACVVNSDCGASNTCREQFYCSVTDTIFCTANSDCPASQTCPSTYLGMPQNLECGGLYTGGGLNAVPLPFPVPDMGRSSTIVTAYNGGTGTMTLGPTTAGQVGQEHCTTGRTCTGGTNNGAHCVLDSDCDSNVCTTNCLFGPPLPIPNAMTPPTSVCTINAVDINASGTAQCNGTSNVSTPLRSNVFLSGDLFTMTTPPAIPGVQPCPLCDRFCVGGTNVNFPCNANGDCNSNNCNVQTTCLGGPNGGDPCTPATSDSVVLGDNQNSYPTSHHCPPEPTDSITDAIGGLPIGFALTSGTITRNAQDLSAQGLGVFAGFCRDSTNGSSLCFEGDTDLGCPVALPPADGNAVPCDTKADCADADTYETCTQRTPGAFSRAAATRIQVLGATDGQCLGDGATHAGTLVSVFDIPPTFNPIVDGAGDLPGPGTALIPGEGQLHP